MKRLFFQTICLGILFALAGSVAWAQSGPPRRQIPPTVLTELAMLDGRFEAALAADCDGRQCFSKGCTYVAHAVADRPASSSMPGLGQELGPSPLEGQAWLTQARCAFAYEANIESDDVQALVRRLQARVSTGWTQVTVAQQALEPLPPYLKEPPPEPEEEEEIEAAPPVPPEPWSAQVAARELWTTLLGDFYWMIGLILLTLAGTTLIWAWRRIGRDSFEERALLAQLEAGGQEEEAPAEPSDTTETEPPPEQIEAQRAAWALRFQQVDPARPDPQLQAMLRELLRGEEFSLLAKMALTFPDRLPAIFPSGGDVAVAKLRFSEYLKQVEPEALPSDAEFYQALERQSLAAALASQRDAETVRSLREGFGAAGLVELMGRISTRLSGLIFALSPIETQFEVSRLLQPGQAAALADPLLRSNRVDPSETEHLFAVLEAARADAPLPEAPAQAQVSDQGVPIELTGALSTLLDRAGPHGRAQLLDQALIRGGGVLPGWVRGLLTPEMLLQLPEETRTDLMLGVEVRGLAAWLSLRDPEVSRKLLATVPNALRESVRASGSFASRAEQLREAEAGRIALAQGLQAQLARLGLSFEEMVGGLVERTG